MLDFILKSVDVRVKLFNRQPYINTVFQKLKQIMWDFLILNISISYEIISAQLIISNFNHEYVIITPNNSILFKMNSNKICLCN